MELLTAKEVAKQLKVCEKSVRNWALKKKIPHYRINENPRFVMDEIWEWMKTKKVEVKS